MTIDIQAVRADTPACEKLVHLNSAGASLMPKPVVQALHDYIDEEARLGGYEMQSLHSQELGGLYDSLASLLNCSSDEIAIVDSASTGWAKGFYSIPFKAGDRILTGQSEYAANYVAYLQVAKRTGAVIEVIPCDENGAIDVAALEAMIDDRVKLVSITHIPTNGGLVNPAEEVGKITRKHGILYILDACQTAGQMPIDVEALGCDMLSATGRKFLRGPRGTGFLYVRKSVLLDLEPSMIDHSSAHWVEANRYELVDTAKRFEFWESNQSTRMGFKVAVDYALNIGLAEIQERSTALANYLRVGLDKIDGVQVRDLGAAPCAIVTFSCEGVEARDMTKALLERAINASASSPDSTLLDALARDLPEMVRFSPHYFNTEAEMDKALFAVAEILSASA